MLYRKYRPQSFSDLENLEAVKKTLLSQLKSSKVGHAYLFYGPKGTGKTTTARLLAMALNCTALTKEGEPCGDCEHCSALTAGRFVDLIEIDAASNRGIDDIRSLREKVVLASVHGRYKVYIIDEVHMLTKEAFNALLKTLEEPPKHAVFILCTTEYHKVPKTIISRCQKFRFARASIKDIISRLQKVSEKEGIAIEVETLRNIAQAASGGYRDAETLLEQVASGQQSVQAIVGLFDTEGASSFIEALINNDTQSAIITVGHLVDSGVDLEYFNKSIIEYLRDILLAKVGVADELVDTSKEELDKLNNFSRILSEVEIDRMITLFTQSLSEIKYSAINQLPLEMAVIRYTIDKGGLKEHVREEPNDFTKEVEENENYNNNIDSIKKCWSEILSTIKPYNHSIEALLRSCRPLKFSKGTLTIEAFYNFHKERLNKIENKQLLEKIAKDVLREDIKVKCIIGEKETNKLEDDDTGIEIFTQQIK